MSDIYLTGCLSISKKCHLEIYKIGNNGGNMYYPRLKDLREDHDLKQKEVAAILGIDQRVYSNYETGKREIPTRFVIQLAEFYHTSTDYILGRTTLITPYPYKK